jgi:filamentous hemagglutinin family protein
MRKKYLPKGTVANQLFRRTFRNSNFLEKLDLRQCPKILSQKLSKDSLSVAKPIITMHSKKLIQNFAAELFKKFTGFSVIISITFAQIFITYGASAENITDVSYLVPDGSTKTTTDRALNNTPIVNIAPPSAAGVSLNNFSNYNVTNENQILNNYKGISTNTNLAGQIYGNPNFAPSAVSEARVIVNQVTSTNRTNINGYVEIAGGRAELIVANPNGISLSGTGFINTSRLGLVSGSVNMSGGAISGFNLGTNAASNVIITGVNTPTYINLGLDASTVDYVDIITRSAQVLGDIHAKSELNFRLGNGTYDYSTKTLNSNTGIDFAPTFALDSNYLGGMYAGKISLIASEAGIGVRTRGDLVSKASDINFNVMGDIDYERIESQTNINLTSNNGKITQGKYLSLERPAITFAKNNITLNGAAGIELNDPSLANNFYAAGAIFLNSSFGLVKNNSTLKAENSIAIDSESFENTSLFFSSNSLSITTSGLSKNTSGSIEAIKNVTIISGSFNNAAIIKAGIDATITSSGNFIDSNQIKANRDLTVTANSGISYNNFYSGRNLNLTNKDSGDIESGYKTYSVGKTDIFNLAGAIILGSVGNPNSGSLFSGENLTISASSSFTSNLDIFSDKGINLTASSITNNQKLTATSGKLTASSSGSFINNGALLVKNFELAASTLFKNTASFQSSEKIIADNSTSFENSSLMQAGENISLTLSSTFLDTNQIKATGNLTISAHGGISYNDLYSGADLSLTNRTSGNITHNYKSYSVGKTDIINNAGNITFGLTENSNEGSLFAKTNLTINASGDITNHSNIFSQAKIDITANGLSNNMRIMAVGISESDLTINLNLNLLNRGLLFANNNINLNVDGTITNDGTYNAEIFALNGNVNINGKLYSASFGNVSKYDFFYLSFDKSSEIWADLLAKGYIDSDGKVTDLFKNLASSSEMSIASTLSSYKDAIFNTLENLSAKVTQSGAGNNSLDRIAKDFDAKAADIYSALYANGYIDSSGKVLQKFYDDTKTSGADGLSLGSDAEISYLKHDIYQLLEDARNGKVIENTFLNISGIVSANLSATLIDELKAKNYIDEEGNITSTFTSLSSASDLDLSADFASYKSDIFNQINAAKSVNKTAITNFDSISYQPLNIINNFDLLYSQLQIDGYIDASGNIQDKFYDDSKTITSSAFLDSYKTAIATIFNAKDINGQITSSDFESFTYLAINNITDSSTLYNQLKSEGFVDSFGNITEKFYTDGISSSTSSLANYQSDVNTILGGISQASLASKDFRKITKSLDNSAERLVGELIEKGYLDENGNKTAEFPIDVASFDLESTAVGGEFETVKTAIFNALNSKDSSYAFSDQDFLGGGFDSAILFNENQILMSNLISSGYLSNKGDIKKSFYDLSGNYTSLVLDSRFNGLKGQIGALLANTSPSPTTITSDNLIAVAQNGTRDKAEQIFNKMVAKGYLNSKGDLTEKVMNEVINFDGTDAEKAAQLSLDDLSVYASGAYQQLKDKYSNTTVKSYAAKLENLNGGKITSSLGSVNIKALTFNNLAKDNKDVVSNPENGVARTQHRGIGWAWKNTVLWGYDAVSSTLTSNQSFLKAGQNINIEANNVWNNSSVITAGNNIDLRTANLKNSRTQFIVSVPYIYETHWKRCRRLRGCNSGRYKSYRSQNATLRSNTASIISSGNSLNIAALADVRLDAASIDSTLTAANPTQNSSNPTNPTASSTSLTSGSSAPSTDTWTITIPTTNNGLFKKAPPTSEYLIETAYNAGDPNFLTGSAYYKSRFGFDPNQNNIKWLGDPFYQWNAINEQIIKITKKQEDWNLWAKNNGMADGNNWQANLNQLIDNAYTQKTELNLIPGVKLTTTQIAALTSDIVWYETETINGQQVSVPRVYLSKNSFNRIELKSVGESAILAAKVNISGNNVSNHGTIFASKNINIFATNNIENGGTISAVGNLSLTSEFGNITSASVINKPQVITNESLPLLVRMASISGENIIIDSGKNISLSNTLLNSNNATLLNAQGDVTIANDDSFRDAVNKLAASSASSSSLSSPSLFSTSSIKDEAATARSAATFSAGTDIEINSSGSINVANNYFNTGGSIFMSATNDITNSNYQITASDNVVMSAGNNINNISTAKTATQAALNPTKIEAGSIVSLDAGNNINNIGATIKGGDLVYLTAANNVNNLALINYSINGQTTNKDQTITSGSTKKGTLTTTTISGYTTDSQTGLTSNAITEAQALASNANNIKSTLIAQGSITSNGNVVIVAGNNLNNKASNITANGAAYLEATTGDINITTAALRNRAVTSGGKKKNSWTRTTDNTNNVESSITVGSDLEISSGQNTSITGSKIDVVGDLTANVGTNLIISNAVNSRFNQTESKKKGSVKKVQSVSSSYVESALESEINANNITLNVGTSGSGGVLFVQGSKMHAENDTNTNAVNTIFQDAVLNEFHYNQKSTSSRGVAKVGTVITSTVGGIIGAALYLVGNITKPLDDGAIRDWTSNQFMDNQFINTKQKNFETRSSNSSIASILEAGNNFTSTSSKDTTIQASKINAENQITINAENLNLLTRSETAINTSEDKVSRALSFRNYNEGSATTKDVINPELTSGTDVINFNISDKVTAQFNNKDWSGTGLAPNASHTTSGADLSYLNSLKDQIDPSKFTLQPITFNEQSWHDANRGLTDIGVGVIVVAAIVISCVLTACTAAPAAASSGAAAGGGAAAAGAGAGAGAAAGGAAAGTAAATTTVAAATATTAAAGAGAAAGTTVATAATLTEIAIAAGNAALVAGATTAATTATISGINASMNANGSMWSQIKTTADSSYKATTSEQSIKNIALSAAIAAIAAGAVKASGGTTSLQQGKDHAVYKPDPELVKANPDLYSNYNGVVDPSVNNIGKANLTMDVNQVGQPVPPYSTNPFTSSFWQGFGMESGFISSGANKAGGMNSMSLMHDPWAGGAIIRNIPLGTQLSIPPAIAVQYCATFPAACGAAISYSMNNNFGSEK